MRAGRGFELRSQISCTVAINGNASSAVAAER
jgi:hypothetical protein